MLSLAQRLLRTIRKQHVISAGDRLAVAVSGGADSVALLLLLLELRGELGIVLSVAHVNHKLRGEESDADARFVTELARGHELELHVCEAPAERDRPREIQSDRREVPGEVASAAGSGIEAAARQHRYQFFRQLAQQGCVTRIATAHTMDDQAETVLLRIFRGTGIRGLAGIHPRIVFEEGGRAFGEVVRPLLGFRRVEVLEFLRQRGQSWREDSSNRDVGFLRNRVRHRLLPLIVAEFGDAAIEHMADLAEIARAEEEDRTQWSAVSPQRSAVGLQPSLVSTSCLGTPDLAASGSAESLSVASADTCLEVQSLLSLPLARQRVAVRDWLTANLPDLRMSFRLVEEALELARGTAGKRMELAGGGKSVRQHLLRGREQLRLEIGEPGSGKDREYDPNYEYELPIPGIVELRELRLSVEARPIEAAEITPDHERQLLNLSLAARRLIIRNWRAGDQYWPAHTSAPKKVKELLTSLHVTGEERKLWPVAAVEGCGLVWMRGFAVPAEFRPPPGAARAIWIRELRP